MTGMESQYDRELEEQANALTTCSICTDVFKHPKVLPCQHTFCLVCLERCYDATNSQRLVPVSSFPCPTCRKACHIPRQNLYSLPTDFKVDQILDLVKVITEARTTQISLAQGRSLCVVCRHKQKQKASDCFCIQCSKSFCSACSEHHNSTPIFQDHTVISTVSAASGDSTSEWNCSLHSVEMKYYCEECEISICTVCILSNHEKHRISDQLLVLARLQRNLERFREELTGKNAEVRFHVDAIARLRQEHVKAFQESESAVLQASREAAAKVRELELETISDLKENNREKLEAINCVENGITQRQDALVSLSNSISEVLKMCNPSEVFESFNRLSFKFRQEMAEQTPEVGTTLRDVFTFVPTIRVKLGELEKKATATEEDYGHGKPSNIPGSPLGKKQETEVKAAERSQLEPNASSSSTGSEFGMEETEINCRPTCGVPPPRKPLEHANALREFFNNLLESTVRTIHQNTTSTSTTNATSAMPNSTTSTNTNVNKIAIQVTGAATPSTISPSSSPSSSCSSSSSSSSFSASPATGPGNLVWMAENFTECRDCCFIGNGQLAAIDYKATSGQLKVYDSLVGGQPMIVVRSAFIVHPWSMCYNISASSLVLTDHGHPAIKAVQMYSPTREVQTYRCSSVERPTGIAMTRSGDYILTETGSRLNKIGLYAQEPGRLRKIREFGPHGDGEDEVLRANYVVVDHNDRIVISDCDSHNIKVFNLKGQQILKFSSCGSDGREMSPQGLAVDDSNNIYVADQAVKAVCKYSPQGNLVDTVVQTRGTPWGISICWEYNLLAVATSKGLEVYNLTSLTC